jgi:hypothetical protein
MIGQPTGHRQTCDYRLGHGIKAAHLDYGGGPSLRGRFARSSRWAAVAGHLEGDPHCQHGKTVALLIRHLQIHRPAGFLEHYLPVLIRSGT